MIRTQLNFQTGQEKDEMKQNQLYLVQRHTILDTTSEPKQQKQQKYANRGDTILDTTSNSLPTLYLIQRIYISTIAYLKPVFNTDKIRCYL